MDGVGVAKKEAEQEGVGEAYGMIDDDGVGVGDIDEPLVLEGDGNNDGDGVGDGRVEGMSARSMVSYTITTPASYGDPSKSSRIIMESPEE